MNRSLPGFFAIVFAAAALLAACGGGSAINSVDNAKGAVIRIVATGSFVDPEVGLQMNAAGSGSGFIIDPSGIAVTNNHVVTGAATLEVYVGGGDKPVSARVLGVSECADLAVIDLEGEGYPYFEWYPDEIDVNLEVRAAGFPLGSPEFTLTRGIVSKARADGETEWASINGVIEHDARINPGNSGGPLLDNNGRVVGVNYAGRPDTGQYFSIAAPLARKIVEQLSGGKDVQSIGINGQAVYDENAGVSGIWVASVETGSPASKAGIEGGDIIIKLENLAIGADGAMKVYCDILRTKGSDKVLKVEVLRFATQEVLEGELNGQPLTQSFSFAQQFEDQVADQPSDGGAYESYVEILDDSGQLGLQVPETWTEIDGSRTEDGDPALRASPDLDAYLNRWDIPGVLFVASPDYAKESDGDLLHSYNQGACASQGRQPYQNGKYTGTVEFFSDCGNTPTARVIVVFRPPDNQFAGVIDMQLVSEKDLGALDQAMNTWLVIVKGAGEQTKYGGRGRMRGQDVGRGN